MNKITIVDHLPAAEARPDMEDVHFAGEIRNRNLIGRDDFTLSLWRHDIAPDASIRLVRPREDHVFYVLEGDLLVGSTPIGVGGAAVVGANATSELRGGPNAASVLHFVGRAESRPRKPGGCVHVLAEPWLEHSPNSSHALYFDSSCPSCSVWLHMTRSDKGRGAKPHYHTEDEIICVVQGQMNLGTREIATGGAIGIGRQVVYSFEPGEDGLGFVNFRQADPFYLPKGKAREEAQSERILMRALLERLQVERLQRSSQASTV